LRIWLSTSQASPADGDNGESERLLPCKVNLRIKHALVPSSVTPEETYGLVFWSNHYLHGTNTLKKRVHEWPAFDPVDLRIF
jgi:hypothetical protein